MENFEIKELPAELAGKVKACQDILVSLGRVVVAFSGGVDSSFLLAMAVGSLGRDNVLAVTNVSAIHPRIDSSEARAVAAELDAEMLEVTGRELEDHRFKSNPPDRCYYCKREIFGSLTKLAAIRGYKAVLSGANADDVGDYRPGARAEAELGIRRPLLEAGLTKAEIRQASRAMGLSTAGKPSMACLASRIPYDQPITAQKLARIEQAETLLRELGFGQYRLRDHETLARIEVPPDEFDRLLANRRRIVDALKQLGYTYITLDLQGFRSGAMNETLGKEIKS